MNQITHAPAHPPDRPDLSSDEIGAIVQRMLDDLEEWVAREEITGTELMSSLMGVCYRLLADSDHPPAERITVWRELAAQVEQLLVNDLQ